MWNLNNIVLNSRLMLGSSLYPSPEILLQCIKNSEASVITVSLSKQTPNIESGKKFWSIIKNSGCHILPNTAGCKTVKDAIFMAQMAREVFSTNWIKLEIIGDDYHLHPNVLMLIEASYELIKQGFEVFPYCTDDIVICERLIETGCKILMPGVAPIGSGQGILNNYNLKILRNKFKDITLIADAGIGRPSDATIIMELGFDGVLLNTAIAEAINPIEMSLAFNYAIKAGHTAYKAGIISKRDFAKASTPLIDTPFWHSL